ncbi:Integral membrane protein [Colletotrichum higginsianum IMI 349063]|uniref:Integral membrane protein n=2 Tax=Colletotrichum higginsianum (strain IMI 349063) TaxID=759273 RepID=A0A1B7Y3L0_COLHI|nr:Integral membrane protein [Colletotrichum higginsianum IMI 349063]OBR06592.1 Integral membrane protein [Colletotrichum higginsianum IMI 349063]
MVKKSPSSTRILQTLDPRTSFNARLKRRFGIAQPFFITGQFPFVGREGSALDEQMSSSVSEYMAEPPAGQGRFDAGTVTIEALALGGTLTSLSVIFVCLRAFTRLSLVKRSFGPDDLCDLGVGVHMWQVKRADYSPSFLMHSLIAIAVYSLSVTTAKLSLLVLYLRLSPDRWFRLVTMALIGFATAYALAYLFLIVFGCRPIHASWILSARDSAKCIDKNKIYLALSGTNIIMDVVCLVLPLNIIIPLQMATRQKCSLILLFATGGFVCFCAIRRTILLPPLFKSTDYTFDVNKQLNWASIEVNAGVVCACVPSLKPFFTRYLPMFVTSRITGSKDKKSNPNYQAYQANNPYSTTIENNKRRRNVQSEAYELHSNDDLSLCSKEEPKSGANEDVAKLWCGHAFRNDCQGHRETIIESRRRDEDSSSMDSVGEIQPVADGISRPNPPQRVASLSIRVTTETRVEYEKT